MFETESRFDYYARQTIDLFRRHKWDRDVKIRHLEEQYRTFYNQGYNQAKADIRDSLGIEDVRN